MRDFSVQSVASWAVTCVTVLSLTACTALRDGVGEGRGTPPPTGIAGEEEEDDCELIVLKRGGDPEVVGEKTPEDAAGLIFLGQNDRLHRLFQIDDEDDEDCMLAFGLSVTQGGPPASSTALAFGTIPAAATLASLAAVLGFMVVSGGGGNEAESAVIPASQTQ